VYKVSLQVDPHFSLIVDPLLASLCLSSVRVSGIHRVREGLYQVELGEIRIINKELMGWRFLPVYVLGKCNYQSIFGV